MPRASYERLDKVWPASTGWLIVSIIFANKLWMADVTSMSLYWVARLPIPRAPFRSPLAPEADSDAALSIAPNRSKRPRKLALSLAVVAAMAAPFISGAYKERPTSSAFLPITPEQKVEWTDIVQGYRNARVCERSGERAKIDCYSQHGWESLLERGYVGPVSRFDIFKYLATNIILAAAAFASVFGLALLIPMLVRSLVFLTRRYWSWLNA